MLNRYFVVLILIFICCGATAQKMRVHAGVVASDLYRVLNDNPQLSWHSDPYKYKIGFLVGISSEFALFNSDKFAIEPQLQFLNLGANREYFDNDWFIAGNYSTKKEPVHIYYLGLPISFSYKLNKVVSINLGPQISFRLNQDVKFRSFVQHSFDSRFDYGLQTGINIALTDKIETRIGFYNGFGNVEQIQYDGIPDNWRARSRYFTLQLAYQFSK